MENNSGFTIKDLLIRLILIIIFIFLLIWLFPMPNLKPLNNQIFADNVERMRNVAKTYYTVERLPENINDYKKMTLKEMIDNKLILPLMDSNGNYCSENDSYVQITKLENEYVIKVYLSCSDTKDYIIEHFGCYDICSDKCQMLETTTTTTHSNKITTKYKTTKKITNKVTYKTTTKTTLKPTTQVVIPTTTKSKYLYEYQFKKTVCSNVFDKYTCPTGYNLTGDKCIKNGSSLITKDAISTTTYVKSTDTKDAIAVVTSNDDKISATKTSKTSTSTINANVSNSLVDKTLSKVQTITADKVTSYDVKAAIGTTKTVYADYISSQGYDIITASKYASGYKWSYVATRTSTNGFEAFENASEKLVLVDSWQEDTCSTCSTMITIYKYYRYKKEYTGIYYSCDAFPGYTLYDTNKCRKAVTGSKQCPTGYTPNGSNCKKSQTTYSCSSYGSSYVLDSSKKTCTKTNTSYSCPSGTSKTSDSKYCSKNVYACPSGTTDNGNGKCSKPIYSCPSNTSDVTYSLLGTKCIVSTKTYNYTCPSGYKATTDPKYCVKTTSKTTYTCDGYDGYTLSGTKCTKTTSIPKTTYSCSSYGSGYNLSDNKCLKTESKKDIKDATKDYKLSCDDDYKWTTKTSLEGWTYTGNKRVLN